MNLYINKMNSFLNPKYNTGFPSAMREINMTFLSIDNITDIQHYQLASLLTNRTVYEHFRAIRR